MEIGEDNQVGIRYNLQQDNEQWTMNRNLSFSFHIQEEHPSQVLIGIIIYLIHMDKMAATS